MKRLLCFIAAVIGWALVGRAVFELGVLPPVVLFILWLGGLIWVIGWVVGSVKEANYLLVVLVAIFAAGGMVGLIAYFS